MQKRKNSNIHHTPINTSKCDKYYMKIDILHIRSIKKLRPKHTKDKSKKNNEQTYNSIHSF